MQSTGAAHTCPAILTRTTAILAGIFFALSLTLALLNKGTTGVGRSILDTPPTTSGLPTQPVVPGAPGGAGASLPRASGPTVPAN